MRISDWSSDVCSSDLPGAVRGHIARVALHITKVAFGNHSVDNLAERLTLRGREGPVFLTTRYLPKRHEEIAGTGSLYRSEERRVGKRVGRTFQAPGSPR